MKPPLTLFKWTLFTTLGWLIGLTLAVVGGDPMEIFKLGLAWMGLAIGGGIGLMQWMALKDRLPNAMRWFTYAAAGQGVVFLILNVLNELLALYQMEFMRDGIPSLVAMVAGTSAGAYLTGLWQEKKILRELAAHPVHWARTSLVAWLTAGLVLGIYLILVLFTQLGKSTIGPAPTLIVFFSVGPIIGLITGKRLIAILSR